MRRDVLNDPFEDAQALDAQALQRDLDAANKTIRELRRQGEKAQARYEELLRAYRMTVENLVRTSGECASLEHERDHWRRVAEQRPNTTVFENGRLALSAEEITAIRKAMARLHHPDTGGDAERMKAWNALLDALERGC
ncbi:MAG: hypothetical protein OHK0022_09870 [Roseiflexaceae bacterium]